MKKAVMQKFLRCSRCDAVLPIFRLRASNRETGHVKHLWCYKCKLETPHVEFREEDDAKRAPSSIPYLVTYSVKDYNADGREIEEKRKAVIQLSLADSIGKIADVLKHELGDVKIKGWCKYG